MPEKKGRKRRPRERRQRRTEEERGVGAPEARQQPSPPARRRDEETLPSKRVRYAGFVLAVITLFVGILTFTDAFAAGREGVDVVLRLAGGIVLIVMALVIGLIALVPERVQAWLGARSSR